MPQRQTGPLDEVLPWVIEFRVVGTASTIQVRVADEMVLGRADSENGIAPEINLAPYGAHVLGVSRRHAMLSAQGRKLVVRDLASANGTRLNGFVLRHYQDYRLRHGDELTLGQLHLQVMFAVVPPTAEQHADLEAETIIPEIGHGRQVLIVEDDADVAAVFGMILEQAGFRVTIMNNAVAALALVSSKLPDAIVLDLLLPDMNGLDLARFVRKQENGDRVPVIVVSGATGGFQMNQALKAGADMFLGKPVGVDELVNAFSALLPSEA
jgi:CheY-like chemotaxis protein